MDNEKEISFGAFDSKLMHQEIFIPEGFTATIDGNKIILKKIEGEDEKVRKALIRFHKSTMDIDGIKGYEIVAWLEKQGEQKPADKVEPKFKVKYAGNEYNVLDIKENMGITWYGIEDEPNHIDYVKANSCEIINVYGIKENGSPYPTKPAIFAGHNPSDEDMKEALRTEYEKGRADAFAQMQQGWSDKEKQMYADIIIEATKKSGVFKEAYKRELVDWLKSLRPQNTWKPSDGQMSALKIATHCPDLGLSRVLKTLYNDLDKLTKE